MTNNTQADFEERIRISRVGTPSHPDELTFYVGRHGPRQVPNPLGNPLNVKGKSAFTPESERWAQALTQHTDPQVAAAASHALIQKGFQQGEAASLYLHVLRRLCQQDTPARREVQHMAQLLLTGHKLNLRCFCHPHPCHAQVIKAAVLGYARQHLREGGAARPS